MQAEQGVRTINHNVGEDLKVECPITGNPGPSIFHWESVDSGQTWVLAAEAACVVAIYTATCSSYNNIIYTATYLSSLSGQCDW